mmetsp:Transcript_46106/g.86070  ORF Transcript_46106/g.86070 Transcript_46106/m.86070 type:complete len:221 (-) Transcript_46106:1544-2206(-)
MLHHHLHGLWAKPLRVTQRACGHGEGATSGASRKRSPTDPRAPRRCLAGESLAAALPRVALAAPVFREACPPTESIFRSPFACAGCCHFLGSSDLRSGNRAPGCLEADGCVSDLDLAVALEFSLLAPLEAPREPVRERSSPSVASALLVTLVLSMALEVMAVVEAALLAAGLMTASSAESGVAAAIGGNCTEEVRRSCSSCTAGAAGGVLTRLTAEEWLL